MPVIVGDHVTADAGTGAVHTAPGHGLDDYVVGSRYGLKVDNPVGDDGRFYASVPLVGGMSIWQANPLIVETLRSQRQPAGAREAPAQLPALLAPQDADHFPRHAAVVYRHGNRARMRTVRAGTLREQAMAAVDAHAVLPRWGRARLEAMIKNRPDWCVSRQRNWGVPMPFFTHKETGELHPRTPELLEVVAQARRSRPASRPGSRSTRPNCWAKTPRTTTRPATRSTSGSIPA